MWNSKRSVKLSIFFCVVAAILLLVMLFIGPSLMGGYLTRIRGFLPESNEYKTIITAICICFYISAVFAAIALYALFFALLNICKDNIFVPKNVNYLRIISWCCIGVFFTTTVGAYFYFALIFIAVAAGFVGMMLRVVKNVMQRAVEMREENDLTI